MKMKLSWEQHKCCISGYALYRFIDIHKHYIYSGQYYSIDSARLPGFSHDCIRLPGFSYYKSKNDTSTWNFWYRTSLDAKNAAELMVRLWEKETEISDVNSLDDLRFRIRRFDKKYAALKLGTVLIAKLEKTWYGCWRAELVNWSGSWSGSTYIEEFGGANKTINKVITKARIILQDKYYGVQE